MGVWERVLECGLDLGFSGFFGGVDLLICYCNLIRKSLMDQLADNGNLYLVGWDDFFPFN